MLKSKLPVNPSQFAKAPSPIVLTLLGIENVVRLEHHAKAWALIFTKPSGRFKAVSPWHPIKAPCPIIFKLAGRFNDVRLLQYAKTSGSI